MSAFSAWRIGAETRPPARARTLSAADSERGPVESAAGMAVAQRPPERIAVRENGRVVLLKLDEVDWIEAADNYVCLHCGTETHVLRETMNAVEARLAPARFVRIHRSAIVNIDRIKELQPWFRGDYQVILRDGTKLILTKANRKKLTAQVLLGSLAG